VKYKVQPTEQLIMIKGTSSGLTFYMNEHAPFHLICEELQKMLQTEAWKQDETISITIHVGYRYISEEEKNQIEEIITSDGSFQVKEFITKVMSKAEVLSYIEQTETKTFVQMVRSGQVLDVQGNLLLIGDVNPGGEVRATGNIYILGKLLGIAHAGFQGDSASVIIASYMNPRQLRIANYLSRSPDTETEGVYMEYGYFHEESNKIVIDSLQKSRHIIGNSERGIPNG